MKRLMIVAVLALVTACAAQARTETGHDASPPPAPVVVAAVRATPPEAGPREPDAPSGVRCDIRATRTAHGVRLEAIAHADRAGHGVYDFVITAHGSGGSSDVTQGGRFDMAAGASAAIGTAEISSARYRAVLTLSDPSGAALCRLERRS